MLFEMPASQVEALKRQAVNRDVEDLAEELCAFDPLHTKAIGRDGMRNVARLAVERARPHGLTQKSTVLMFAKSMLQLGSFFDTDPGLTWAQAGLNLPLNTVTTQVDRANRLRSDLFAYLYDVVGAEGENNAIFRNKMRMLIEDKSEVASRKTLIEYLLDAHPKRCEKLPEGALDHYISQAHSLCSDHGMKEGLSRLILSALMLVFGHGIAKDPLLPWLGKLFAKLEPGDDADEALRLLVVRFLDGLEADLADLKAGGLA